MNFLWLAATLTQLYNAALSHCKQVEKTLDDLSQQHGPALVDKWEKIDDTPKQWVENGPAYTYPGLEMVCGPWHIIKWICLLSVNWHDRSSDARSCIPEASPRWKNCRAFWLISCWQCRTFSEFLHQPCDNITMTFPLADGVTRELVGYIRHRRAAQQLAHQPWFVRAQRWKIKKK